MTNNISILVPHQITIIKTDEEEFLDFTAMLEDAVRDIQQALLTMEKVDDELKELQTALDSRSFWFQFKNTFNGSSDKELATLLQKLGLSLGLTQKVVKIILKIQTKKNHLLTSFNDALIKKIANIQGDTHTLDNNQKQATLFFLEELQTQINEQIQQQNLVESHEFRLNEHEQWHNDKNISEKNLIQKIVKLESENIAIKDQMTVINTKLKKIEEEIINSNLPKAIFIRNIFSIISFVLASISLFLIFNT